MDTAGRRLRGCRLQVVRCSMFPLQRSASDAQAHCRNNATATRTPRELKTPNSKLFCDQRHAIKRMLLRAWNGNCNTAEQSDNEMISHVQMKRDRSVPGRST